MAPRFTKEATLALKRAMKQRQDHILTDEDYKSVSVKTGISFKQIEDWQNNTRKNYKAEARVAYLESDKDLVSAR